MSDPRVEVQRANEAIADALRIKEGDQVVSRHYQRFIDGIPFSLQTSFYPMSLVLQGATRLIEATDIPEGTVVYLDEKLGVKQVGYRDSIQVRPPNDQEAVFFRIPADGQIPVFEVYRIAFDQNRKRVRLTITVYPVDRNRLVVSVGDVPGRSAEKAGQHGRTATAKGSRLGHTTGCPAGTRRASSTVRTGFRQPSVISRYGGSGAGQPPWRTGEIPGARRHREQGGGGHGEASRASVRTVPL